MMRKFSLLLVGLLILAAIVPSASFAQDDAQPIIGFWEECPTPDALSGEINIGVMFALTEGASIYGIPQEQAVKLAVEQINASGYLGAATLAPVYEDGGSAPETAITAMTKLVEEDGVVAVLGPTLSSQAFAADPIAQEAGVVVLAVSNTAGGITEMGDYIFRNSLPEASVIPGNLATAVDILGLETVGLLYGDDDDFTVAGYNVFLQTLDELGVEIVREETFQKGDTDFNAQLTSVIAEEPDAIVLSILAAEAQPMIQQARALGYTGPIIGGNGVNSLKLITDLGDDANGLIVGAAWNIANESEQNAAFVEAYSAAYSATPDQFTAQAYTGAWLLASAIRCANSADSAAIRDALAAITDFDSPLGLYSFDENRNPVHDPVSQIAIDGKFEILTADSAGMVFGE
jgi:branched-chain amino acid transport system substrate-binding protein